MEDYDKDLALKELKTALLLLVTELEQLPSPHDVRSLAYAQLVIERFDHEPYSPVISACPDLYLALEDLIEQIQSKGIASDFKFDQSLKALEKAEGEK